MESETHKAMNELETLPKPLKVAAEISSYRVSIKSSRLIS